MFRRVVLSRVSLPTLVASSMAAVNGGSSTTRTPFTNSSKPPSLHHVRSYGTSTTAVKKKAAVKKKQATKKKPSMKKKAATNKKRMPSSSSSNSSKATFFAPGPMRRIPTAVSDALEQQRENQATAEVHSSGTKAALPPQRTEEEIIDNADRRAFVRANWHNPAVYTLMKSEAVMKKPWVLEAGDNLPEVLYRSRLVALALLHSTHRLKQSTMVAAASAALAKQRQQQQRLQ